LTKKTIAGWNLIEQFEGILDDLYLRLVFGEADCYDVETRPRVETPVRFQVIQCQAREAALFPPVDGLFCGAGIASRARFDLDENQGVPVFCDQIQFPEGAAVVEVNGLIADSFDGFQSQLFASLAELHPFPCQGRHTPLKVVRWMGHQPIFLSTER